MSRKWLILFKIIIVQMFTVNINLKLTWYRRFLYCFCQGVLQVYTWQEFQEHLLLHLCLDCTPDISDIVKWTPVPSLSGIDVISELECGNSQGLVLATSEESSVVPRRSWSGSTSLVLCWHQYSSGSKLSVLTRHSKCVHGKYKKES